MIAGAGNEDRIGRQQVFETDAAFCPRPLAALQKSLQHGREVEAGLARRLAVHDGLRIDLDAADLALAFALRDPIDVRYIEYMPFERVLAEGTG